MLTAPAPPGLPLCCAALLMLPVAQTTLPSCCRATTCCVSRASRRSRAAAAACSSAPTAPWRRGPTTRAHSSSPTCCDKARYRERVCVYVLGGVFIVAVVAAHARARPRGGLCYHGHGVVDGRWVVPFLYSTCVYVYRLDCVTVCQCGCSHNQGGPNGGGEVRGGDWAGWWQGSW